jgi:hypothetical protein
VGLWNIQQSGGDPIDLSGEGVMSIHADGTVTLAFDYYLGTELDAGTFLISPGLGTWKKIGHNKYQIFVSTISTRPTPYPNPESGPYGVFPTNILNRGSCVAEFELSCDKCSITSIPSKAECSFYEPDDLRFENPISSTCCEFVKGFRVGK